MTELSDQDVRGLLKASVPAPPSVSASQHDAWLRVRQRIEHRPRRQPHVLEYVLIAGILLPCLLRPSLIAFLLLHL